MSRAKFNEKGLGKALLRNRFKGQRRTTDTEGMLHTTELNDGAKWVRLQSITEQKDLDDFLHTAELQEKDFTAEKQNVKIITDTSINPFLLTADQEKDTLEKHIQNKDRLKVPRRPMWTKQTSAEELHRLERESFLNWRRDLATLQEDEGFLLTPFERNLEVWRQLWRVLERSQVIVQIVDARNPLVFRSEDLEIYINEIDSTKKSILLINKADMLTHKQREMWADYFEANNIEYMFFSAKDATTNQADQTEIIAKRERLLEEKTLQTVNAIKNLALNPYDEIDDLSHSSHVNDSHIKAEVEAELNLLKEKEFNEKIHKVQISSEDRRTRVLTPEELVGLLISESSPPKNSDGSSNKITIGLVGYPNVGKSSTINSLVGAKKVSVGSMPGKTKHFQTIPLTGDITLCDCPGLVFPTFATTTADMVCNGVLPIDQLREYSGPAALISRRIPKWVIEATYGINIYIKSAEEGGDGIPTAEELLISYAAARGLAKSSQGNPDESRAARRILKDYVDGKLLFTHAPPTVEQKKFNADLYDPSTFSSKIEFEEDEQGNIASITISSDKKKIALASSWFGKKNIDEIDSQFFIDKSKLKPVIKKSLGAESTFGRRVDDKGREIAYVDSVDSAISDATKHLESEKTKNKGGKKHKKGKKNVKVHSGSIYE
ncbi:hypothetical protein BB561_006792 [Smittium simulii]|uniref:CP-type G domain-containing protein n=1 Tax=Smittium simulii TaxID=133385 RepID=A0A2T9Y1I6_9FUNG|nr:hypothetical protein BB561_006792 [Smittium simulii]